MPNKSNEEIVRHPLAIAWDEWLASKEGQECRAANTLAHNTNIYLENRLHRAFDAGASTAESNLAREVLGAISTMAGGTHGGGLIVVSRDATVERLLKLFTRLNVKIEEG